jgi:protein-tyrosine kinase
MNVMTTDTPHTAQPALVLPTLEETQELAWSTPHAKDCAVYGFDSRDIRSRPFNLLRSRLLKLHRSKGWRLFGVVSATPGVGKSFVATNLAAALSRTPGLTTYLVDLDLRRGSVAQNFRYEAGPGVRGYLEGEFADLRETGFHPAGEKLIVLPTDNSFSHSAELLANEHMDRLVGAMRAEPQNSVFICDLPPVFANDDAAIVTRKLDAYLLIVEDGRTTKKQIRDSLNVLDQAPCAGAVLNRFSGGLISDSYGYSYGSGYSDYYK